HVRTSTRRRAMATPNDPKKPSQPSPKPGATPQKPGAVPPKPGAAPQKPQAAKPGATPQKPGAAPQKPGATPAKGQGGAGKAPPPKKPVAKGKGDSGGGKRKIGQVLIDLGFIDEDQLWEILEESKSTGQMTGQCAINRGLINEDQLLAALAEQHNLKTVNLQEIKPSPEALEQVQETMANLYKIIPISFDPKAKVLTIAVSDPNNLLGVLDDLRNLLGISEVVALLAPANQITELLTKAYAGKELSIIDVITEMETNPKLAKKKGKEVSIDMAQMIEQASEAPVRKLI